MDFPYFPRRVHTTLAGVMTMDGEPHWQSGIRERAQDFIYSCFIGLGLESWLQGPIHKLCYGQGQNKWPPSVTIRVKNNLLQTSLIFIFLIFLSYKVFGAIFSALALMPKLAAP